MPTISAKRLRELLAGERDTDVLGVADPARDEGRPWRAARPLRDRLAGVDLPRRVRAALADRLYVERDALPPALLDAVRRLAAFANPEFGERQAMRLSTALTPRLITCFESALSALRSRRSSTARFASSKRAPSASCSPMRSACSARPRAPVRLSWART